jgi:hypothetical protein
MPYLTDYYGDLVHAASEAEAEYLASLSGWKRITTTQAKKMRKGKAAEKRNAALTENEVRDGVS